MPDNPRPVLAYRFTDLELEIVADFRTMRIRCWPEPRALLSEMGREWRGFRPPFRLIHPAVEGSRAAEDPSDHKSQALNALRDSLPPEIRTAVECFESYQWNLIDLLYRCPQALDLVHSNPVLAHWLANNDEFVPYCRKAPAARAMDHVRHKQREIAAWLGFPGTVAAVRILRKIVPEASDPHQGRLLRRAMNEAPEVIKLLAHVKTIHDGVLALVTNLKLLPVISPRLLDEVSQKEDNHEALPAADLLVNAIYQFHQLRRRGRIPIFDSQEAIRSFHEDNLREVQRREEEERRHAQEREEEQRCAQAIEEERLRRQQERREARRRRTVARLARPFPPPPIIGTADIIPLTTIAQLEEEGLSQQNCVGSYHNHVCCGRTYIYAVLRPQRATLAITRQLDGGWYISELLAAGNKPVKHATRMFVEQWLSPNSLPH
jgi:hypothetical protein